MKNHHRKIQPIWPLLKCNFHWAAPRPCQSTRHNVRGCVCPSEKFLFRTGTGMTMIGSKLKTILLMFSIRSWGSRCTYFFERLKTRSNAIVIAGFFCKNLHITRNKLCHCVSKNYIFLYLAISGNECTILRSRSRSPVKDIRRRGKPRMSDVMSGLLKKVWAVGYCINMKKEKITGT